MGESLNDPDPEKRFIRWEDSYEIVKHLDLRGMGYPSSYVYHTGARRQYVAGGQECGPGDEVWVWTQSCRPKIDSGD